MDTGLAPAFARITYTGETGIHHAIIPVNIDAGATPGVEPDLILKDASTIGGEAGVTAYVDLWKEFLVNTQDIGLCEFYKVDPTTGEGTFLYGFNIGTTGFGAGAGQAKIGLQMTFKLVNGRVFRALAMEGNTLADVDQRPPYLALSPQREFSDYVCGASSIVYGRGNSYPFAPLRLLSKEYDALRKRTGL